MSKLYGLVVRWLFVSRNGIKVQFLGVVGFKSSTLTVYCLSSWFVCQQRKTYSNLCVLCWLSHLSWFWGPKFISPFFWPWVTNHVEKLRRKPKIFVKVIRRFWYVQHVGLIFFYSTRSSQSCNFGKILQCLKKTRHVSRIKILRYNFFNSV